MKKLRIKTATIAILAIVITLCSQGTLAYYSTVGTATNVVTSGEIKFIIHERTDKGTDFPKDGVYVQPGDVVSKEVSIENICEHPFYLRVKMVYGSDNKELTAEDCLKLNIDTENWQAKDGWYYYKGIVLPGHTTPEVFTNVEIIGSKVDQNNVGDTLELTVVAHAVQSENNPVNGTATYEAVGWPQE